MIQSISDTPGGNSSSFSYDGNGPLTLLLHNDGSKTSIAYLRDTITEPTYNTSGGLSGAKVLTTDSFGLAISYITLDTTGTISAYGQYSYDGTGHQIREQIFDNGMNPIQQKVWSYDDAGDLIGLTVTDNLVQQNNEEYFYDKYYISQTNTTDYQNKGKSYYGNGSHNLIKAMHRLNYLQGNVIYFYTYSFDEYGRTVTKTAKDHNGHLKYVSTYVYN